MRRSIVVAGSVNLDLVCTGKRFPAPGETVTGETFETFHGGKGANQAVAVGRLGFPVSMIAKVGDDQFGPRLRRALRAENVNVRAVGTAKGTASGVALITVDDFGQNSITVIPGANAQLLPRDLEKSLPQLRAAGMILTQLEIPMETVEYLCTIAGRFYVPLMLDPAPAKELPREMLRHVTYLTPNETETRALCAIPPHDLNAATVAEVALTLQASGPANVIIKMGGTEPLWRERTNHSGWWRHQGACCRLHRSRGCLQRRLGGGVNEGTWVRRGSPLCRSRRRIIRHQGRSSTGNADGTGSEVVYERPSQQKVSPLK